MKVDKPDPKQWPGFRPNLGRIPRPAIGKRVRVVLNHGSEALYSDNPMHPPGWKAENAKWDLDDSYPFAIALYMVI